MKRHFFINLQIASVLLLELKVALVNDNQDDNRKVIVIVC